MVICVIQLTFDSFAIELSENFHIEEKGQKHVLKSTLLNRDLFAFDSVELDHLSFNPRYKVYFDNEWWNIYFDNRFSYESCIIGKNTKLGFQTFHLFSLNPDDSTNLVEMHQHGNNVHIQSEKNGILSKDDFYDAHIYQEIKRNFNQLFFCRSNDFSAIYVFDCVNANSFSLPFIDGIFSVNNYSFSYFAYSSNRYYLLSNDYKTKQSASASSNVSYTVWNDFIFAQVGKMTTFYQKAENNWAKWADSTKIDINFSVFYSKNEVLALSKSTVLFKLDSTELAQIIIKDKHLVSIDKERKVIQIYNSFNQVVFSEKLTKKYFFKLENNEIYILKRRKRVKHFVFENGKFEIENLSK